jgi:hypothetical protein
MSANILNRQGRQARKEKTIKGFAFFAVHSSIGCSI